MVLHVALLLSELPTTLQCHFSLFSSLSSLIALHIFRFFLSRGPVDLEGSSVANTLRRVPEAPYNSGLIIAVFPVPVAVLSEAQVCSSLIAEIASSKPAECMDVCLLCLLCAV